MDFSYLFYFIKRIKNLFTLVNKVKIRILKFSVKVTGVWSGGALPNVTKGPLNDTYNFHSMIFHWGPSNDEGSEHTLDYVKFPMELQMVHVKKCYTSPQDRSLLHTKDAVAIISYFLQVYI